MSHRTNDPDIVIAIDGPSGVGKSSVAGRVARALNWTFLDTGSMYRAIAFAWIRAGRDDALIDDDRWLRNIKLEIAGDEIRLNGVDISGEIRTAEVSRQASRVSAHPKVRALLTKLQRKIGAANPSVLEGRDIGTVVFPHAFLKIFLTASSAERARRRWRQLGGESAASSREDIERDINQRDHQDANRNLAPLKPAEDAWHLDTEHLTEDQVIDAIVQEAHQRLSQLRDSTTQ